MKKLKSKRGFTLVEIMVAFVIFAIMAAMVSAIISATMSVKQENLDIEREIIDQQTAYYIETNLNDRKFEGDTTVTDVHDLKLDFGSGLEAEIKYNIVDPNAAGADNFFSLEYMVGNVDYSYLTKGAAGEDPDKDKNQPGSITTRMDSRIYGTNGLDGIELEIEKDLTYTNGHRYFISIEVDSTYSDNDKQIVDVFKYFVQARLNFTDENQVLDCGYVEYSSNKFGSVLGNWQSGMSTIEIVPTSPYSVRISGLQLSGSSLQVESGSGKGIYVTLAQPLEEKISSIETLADPAKTMLDQQTTSIAAKVITNYVIESDTSHAGALNVGEARAWLAKLRAQSVALKNLYNTTPDTETDKKADYQAKLAAIDNEITDVVSVLDTIQLKLNANEIFGYSGAAAAEAGTEVLDGTGKKYQFGEYVVEVDEESNLPIYQPGVLGGFPIEEVPETPGTTETSETTES